MHARPAAVLLAAVVFMGVTVADTVPALPACAVIGFENRIDNAEWKDARVGMGLRAILAQSLFETGLVALIEEKPEMAALIDTISKQMWNRSGSQDGFSPQSVLAGSGTTWIAGGKVFHFGKPRTKASLGPVHLSKHAVELKIEVTVENMATHKKYRAVGKGSAVTTASSGLFTFHGENLEADQTMVGTAARKAIESAVQQIATGLRKDR